MPAKKKTAQLPEGQPLTPLVKARKRTSSSAAEAGPGGRPTDFRPEYCEMLVAHMAKGYTFNSFGAEVGCARSTLNLWQKTHASFSDAHERGVEALERNIVERGWAIAEGRLLRTYKKTFIIDGQPVEHEVTEPAVGNSGAFMAIAKNALGWSDKKEVSHSGPGGGPIQQERVVMTAEQKLARLEQLRRQRELAGK